MAWSNSVVVLLFKRGDKCLMRNYVQISFAFKGPKILTEMTAEIGDISKYKVVCTTVNDDRPNPRPRNQTHCFSSRG